MFRSDQFNATTALTIYHELRSSRRRIFMFDNIWSMPALFGGSGRLRGFDRDEGSTAENRTKVRCVGHL